MKFIFSMFVSLEKSLFFHHLLIILGHGVFVLYFFLIEYDWIQTCGVNFMMVYLYHCSGPFWLYWARLPPTVLGPNILSKEVETGPVAT